MTKERKSKKSYGEINKTELNDSKTGNNEISNKNPNKNKSKGGTSNDGETKIMKNPGKMN